MSALRPTIETVASLGTTSVEGSYYRHAARGRDAFIGGVGGRWGASFPVIYLGQPESSVVIEAYRHLVEDAGVPAEHVAGRILYTVPIRVTKILDLTQDSNRAALGLTDTDLTSDVGDYGTCQHVAAAAHQLRLHGIIAPAAHRLGVTLALFRERLPLAELPTPTSQTSWEQLPADPRRLRPMKEPSVGEAQ